ncbi:U1 snRNP protein [Polyrhizophydium stewartii]|uniref:U1 snRNP protein n=1 Tax=Polyrhizophydium stewartii TaxID=2732419 RepID=A0ABR4NLN6_9FUNG
MPEIHSERLETLQTIKKNKEALLKTAPEKQQASEQLDRITEGIEQSVGRGLSGDFSWSVDPDDVEMLREMKLGKGSFGEVFEGIWTGERVAIKMLNGEVKGDDAVSKTEKEASMWYPLNHPNVLRLRVVCLNADHPFIVMERKKQDLAKYLKATPETNIIARIKMMLGIARGMQYLHELEKPIIHGDLKEANVLIGDDGSVCITDFGLAFVKANSKANTKRRSGDLRWVAPEKYKRCYELDKPSDVFSFAMAAVEILSGEVPFPELNEDQEIRSKIAGGEKPPQPPGTPEALWQPIQDFWHHKPEMQPEFKDIVERLEEL